MSYLRFYKSQYLLPERNAIFETLNEVVLGTPVLEIPDFQFQRIELRKKIKVNLPQLQADYNNYNVVDIQNPDDPRIYYYFIVGKPKQLAQHTVEFELVLDVLNTYKVGTDYSFTDRTRMIREHKDRFYDSTTPLNYNELDPKNIRTMIVDKEDEGTGNPVKYKLSGISLNDPKPQLNQKWYLAYTSDGATDKAPLKVELYPENNNTIRLGNTGVYRITADTMTLGVVYYFYNINSYNQGATVQCSQMSSLLNGTITGSYYGFSCAKYIDHIRVNKVTYDNGTFTIGNAVDLNTTADITIRPVNTLARLWTISGSQNQGVETDTGKIMNIGTEIRITSGGTIRYATAVSSVDRSSPNLQKLIECPYCPIDITFDSNVNAVLPTGWELVNTTITYRGETSMLHDVLSVSLPQITVDLRLFGPPKVQRKLIGYEPKLLNSNYLSYKLSYDNYAMEIKYENVKDYLGSQSSLKYEAPRYDLMYKQSDNVSSSLIFKPEFRNCNYNEEEDYPMILSNRNNESTQYNNQYLNYMRTDYQYDKKLQEQQIGAQWSQFGISLAGTFLTGVVGSITGNPVALSAAISTGTSTIGSIAGIVQSTMQRETTIQSKIESLKAQGTSVSGANDLSLLNYYNGNKLKQYQYMISEELRWALYDLFFKCGYASNRIGLPHMNTRYRFDYCQCEPDLISNTVPEEMINEIKGRYSAGVTVFHYRDDGYDMLQQYENWEVGLVGE